MKNKLLKIMAVFAIFALVLVAGNSVVHADEAEDMYINEIMPDKLKLNLEYIEKSNVFFDIYIIFKTIIICL